MNFLDLTESGLRASSRQEIYASLTDFARAAYGDDISLDAGNSFDAFLNLLADSLSDVAGSAQSFSELFAVKTASGNYLDFIAGTRGVLRKTRRNQRVTVTVDVTEVANLVRPYVAARGTIVIQDTSGRQWTNLTQLYIHKFKFAPSGTFATDENYQGTCEFGLLPLDGYDATLLFAGNVFTVPDTSQLNGATFINSVNASAPILNDETDAQLRARFDAATYANAQSVVEGLRSQLLKTTSYVRIIENLTNSSAVNALTNPYGLAPHSIWCIVGGGSTTESADDVATVTEDKSDVSIAQTILYYKSLGCGVSVYESVKKSSFAEVINGETKTLYTGNFKVFIPMGTMTAEIPFTRLVDNEVTFNVTLKTSSVDSALKNSVAERVSLALQEYVSTLQPGEPITTSAKVSAIQSVLSKYAVGLFDYTSSTNSYAIGSDILIYQRAIGGSATVEFTA